MKKSIIYLAAAILAVAACSKEQPEPIHNDAPQGVSITLKATILEATKATVADPSNPGSGTNESLATTWDSGDQIAIHTKNNALVTLTATGSGSTAEFTGNIPAGDEIEDGAIAYYPASIAVAGNAGTVNLPSSYASADAAKKGITLRGTVNADGTSATFTHMGAMLRITATDVPDAVTSIVLSANKGISGALAVESNEIKGGSSASSVSIASVSSERASGTAVLCFPLPVVTLSDGFSIDFKVNDDVISRQSTSKSREFTAASYVVMKSFPVEYVIVPGSFNTTTNWDATYHNPCVMHIDPDHSGWYVLENIGITTSDTFKFLKKKGDQTTWVGELVSTAQDRDKSEAKAPQVTHPTGDTNIKLNANGTYDLYYNPTVGKFCVLNHGDIWSKKLCIVNIGHSNLFPYDYSNYFIHVYGVAVATGWKDFYSNVISTINNVSYIVFDCSVENGYIPDGTNTLMFRDANEILKHKVEITTSQSNDEYGISIIADNNYSQFTDLSSPTGLRPSNYYLVGNMPGFSETTSWDTTDYKMDWDGHLLAYKGLTLEAKGYEFKFRNGADWNSVNFGLEASNTYQPEVTIPVTNEGSKPNILLNITTAGSYDFYFNIFTKKAYVMPSGSVPAE